MTSSHLLLSAILNSLTVHITTSKDQSDILAELRRILPVQLRVIDAGEVQSLIDSKYDNKEYCTSRDMTRNLDPIENSYDTKSFLESIESVNTTTEPQTAVSILEQALQSKAVLDKITKRKINQTLRKEKKKEKKFLHKKNILMEETDLLSPSQSCQNFYDQEEVDIFEENVLVVFNMRKANQKLSDDIDSLRHGRIKTPCGIKTLKLPRPFSIILVSMPGILVKANIRFNNPDLSKESPFSLSELRDSDFDNKVYCGLDLEAYLALIYHQISMKQPVTALSLQQSIACAKVVAGLNGRDFVLPIDVEEIAKHTLTAAGVVCDDYEAVFNKIRPV